MKIKIINPNTTQSMTDKIAQSAHAVAHRETEIIAVSPIMGPATIESYYDEALSAVGVLDEIRQGEQHGIDAYILACFGDPALYAARELTTAPVLGIAEVAMHMASFISPAFSVVTTLQRTVNMSWHLAERYGMTRFCKNVRACEIAVADLEHPESDAFKIILNECKLALKEDATDCIVLGCAGMSDLCLQLQQKLGVAVIDGVTAAVKQAEALVALQLKTTQRGDWALPPKKNYTGILSDFGHSVV
ncbi:MAG: aspartate/glutamate racemase family protein [Acinetobacter sp.]